MYARDSDGKVIDHHTNTVEDAAKFEAHFNSEPDNEPDPSDYMDEDQDFSATDECPKCEEGTLDFDMAVYRRTRESVLICSEEECEFTFAPVDREECGCSDPCCPCSGSKRGSP